MSLVKNMQDQVSAQVGPKEMLLYVLRSRPLVLLVLIVILSISMAMQTPNFLSSANLSAVLLNASQSGIMVVGMTILMVGGVFDLSIGSTLALCGVVTGYLIAKQSVPPTVAIIIGLLVGLAAGFINGWIVTRQKINALITTLATMSVYRGITQLISGTGVSPIDKTFAKVGQTMFLGFQTPFWFMIIIVIVFSFAVSKTRFFRQFYYVGGNERAAKLSGIRSENVMLIGFMIMGVLAAMSGILGAARLNSAVVSAGIGVELQIITAAVLGGANLKGGEGTVLGAFLGVLFIALIQNAMIILKLNVFWQNIVIGIVLLLAVSLDRWKQKTRA
ncbi:ABC transporter permease [Paenibacillus thalictri]|uniref:Autoinducer 2 import system permease protein LsrC n=1 Tax=Paenibacillus thalictri TaxID=2527873 RepID=A0A4Q9DIS3_9BACL|nr:ABC transporter permease [Paenibacillus thalictri]TBL70294.1 ABC transporter permease [Paenibacillus thalictri]